VSSTTRKRLDLSRNAGQIHHRRGHRLTRQHTLASPSNCSDEPDHLTFLPISDRGSQTAHSVDASVLSIGIRGGEPNGCPFWLDGDRTNGNSRTEDLRDSGSLCTICVSFAFDTN